MRTKHWLPLFSSFVAASIIVACGSDDSAPSGGAGAHSGGAGGAHAGAPGTAGTGGAHAGAPSGGSTSAGAPSGGAANGGASAGAGDTPGDAGSGGAVEEGGTAGTSGGASGGTAGATAGAGGASAGAGGASGGAGGAGAGGASAGAGGASGGAAGVNLCDKALWKYTFQLCPRGDAGGSQPTMAVDGNVATVAASGVAQNGSDFFAVIDLHGAANVSSLVIDYGTGQAGNYEGDASVLPEVLQGSNDGVTFTDIVGAVNGGIINHKITITVPSGVTHRYLKLVQKGTSPTAKWWTVPEVNLTCSSNGTPAAPPADAVGPVPKANWKIATPNSACTGANVAPMVDGNVTSQWQSQGQPGIGYWVRVDLGSPISLSNVDYKIAGGTDFPVKVTLQTSADDITYVDVKTGVTGAVDTKIVLDTPVTTRFFRIVSEAGTTGGSWWSIGELDVNVP